MSSTRPCEQGHEVKRSNPQHALASPKADADAKVRLPLHLCAKTPSSLTVHLQRTDIIHLQVKSDDVTSMILNKDWSKVKRVAHLAGCRRHGGSAVQQISPLPTSSLYRPCRSRCDTRDTTLCCPGCTPYAGIVSSSRPPRTLHGH